MFAAPTLPARAQFVPIPPILKSRRATWMTLLASSAVAIACSSAIYQLNHMADRSHYTRLLLTQTKEQVSRLNALEWEAISKGKIDGNSTVELAAHNRDTTRILSELRAIQQPNTSSRLNLILGLYGQYKTALDQGLTLVA